MVMCILYCNCNLEQLGLSYWVFGGLGAGVMGGQVDVPTYYTRHKLGILNIFFKITSNILDISLSGGRGSLPGEASRRVVQAGRRHTNSLGNSGWCHESWNSSRPSRWENLSFRIVGEAPGNFKIFHIHFIRFGEVVFYRHCGFCENH